MMDSHAPTANGAGVPPPGRDDFAPPPRQASTALRVAAPLVRGWKRVLGVTLATTMVAALAALVLPKTYVTGTVLVPFAGSASRSSIALSGLPAGVAGLIGGGIGGASPAERILGPVLGSRALSDSIIRRVGRDAKEQQVVAEVLHDGVRVARNPDGSMVVQVRAPNGELAARIANAYPATVNRILSIVSTEGALTKQAFLRTELDTAEARLTISEQRYIEFAQRRAAPAPEQQAQRSIDAAATLQQGIFEQEIAIAQLRRTATPDNPDLRAAEALLVSRRAQLQQLTSGAQRRSSVFIPVEQGAELRVASTRVERQYQQDERVYASLTAALEDAQIDASNSLPVLSVLDAALVPDRPTLDVPTAAALGFSGGLALGVIVVGIGEVLARMRRDPANAELVATFSRRDGSGRRAGPNAAHAA